MHSIGCLYAMNERDAFPEERVGRCLSVGSCPQPGTLLKVPCLSPQAEMKLIDKLLSPAVRVRFPFPSALVARGVHTLFCK